MSAVGVRELKNRLTHYLARAKEGEEVVVTERGKPIVLLQAIRTASDTVTRDARLARLSALGIVTVPSRSASRRVRPVRVRGKSVSDVIREDRR
jgi:prevent-host-death family protein